MRHVESLLFSKIQLYNKQAEVPGVAREILKTRKKEKNSNISAYVILSPGSGVPKILSANLVQPYSQLWLTYIYEVKSFIIYKIKSLKSFFASYKCISFKCSKTMICKNTLQYTWRKGRPATKISCASHILLIFSFEPPRNPRPSNLIFF